MPQAMKLFGGDAEAILAECDCGRVSRIRREFLTETSDGYQIPKGVMCKCGKTSTLVRDSSKCPPTTPAQSQPVSKPLPENNSQKEIITGVRALIALGLLIGGIWFFWGGGLERKVASDQIEKYEMAKRNGNKTDACIEAGVIAAAYLDAKDEDKY